MLSEDQMRADQKEWCCPLKCSQKISFGDFKQARMSFWGECSEKQQRQFVFSFFQVAGGTTVARANDLKFLIAGKQVCRKAWLRAHHISNGRLVVHVTGDLKARTNLTMILRKVREKNVNFATRNQVAKLPLVQTFVLFSSEI